MTDEIDRWPCHCGGDNPGWKYHSDDGCADTGQAFAFVGGGKRYYPHEPETVSCPHCPRYHSARSPRCPITEIPLHDDCEGDDT